MSKTNQPPNDHPEIQSLLYPFNDGFITPKYTKTLLSRCFVALTTNEQFHNSQLEEEELTKIQITFSRIMDLIDKI